MKSLKKNKNLLWKTLLIPILTFAILAAILVKGADHFHAVNNEQGVALTEQAIRKAVLQCYAAEGIYPANLDYLVQHYNLKLDEEKYWISYDCFASNIMPEIFVFLR